MATRQPVNTYTLLGVSNDEGYVRADEDYYATDPHAVELLLDAESFSHEVWEPAVGGGSHSKGAYCERI